MEEKDVCPRCKELTLDKVEVRNALSRRDNDTYICSGCGTEEAMLDSGMTHMVASGSLEREKNMKALIEGKA